MRGLLRILVPVPLDLHLVKPFLTMNLATYRKTIATEVDDNATVSSKLNFTFDTYGYSHARVTIVIMARFS